MVGFTLTQMRFYDAHQRVHDEWRPRSTPWLLSHSAEEYRAMLRATTHVNTDASVERARRSYVLVLAIAAAYAVIGFPLALLFLA